MKPPAGPPSPRRQPRRARRARADGSSAAVTAASATLALAWLILLSAPVPSDGFFRPTTRTVKAPGSGSTRLSSLPTKNRPAFARSIEGDEDDGSGAHTGAPVMRQRGLRRYSGSPLLMGKEGEAETTEGDEEDDEEDDEDGVKLPTIEVPEMMSEEVRGLAWPGVRACVNRARRRSVLVQFNLFPCGFVRSYDGQLRLFFQFF